MFWKSIQSKDVVVKKLVTIEIQKKKTSNYTKTSKQTKLKRRYQAP